MYNNGRVFPLFENKTWIIDSFPSVNHDHLEQYMVIFKSNGLELWLSGDNMT